MKYSIFGESHGPAIGVLIEGLPAGMDIDLDFIKSELARRAPGQSPLSTKRSEADQPEILSGVFEGKTTGAPFCAIIRNTNTRSGDYEDIRYLPRPGHADYSGYIRYGGNNDYRGGGHFSGRLTAPLVLAGALAKQILAQREISVGAHIQEIAGISDAEIDKADIDTELLRQIIVKPLAVLDDRKSLDMVEAIIRAKERGDSLGGIIECFVLGIPAGVGEPGLASVESVIASHLFAVPAVKGLEFGAGFAFASMYGSEANDPFFLDKEQVRTRTNNSGGINGGITNGMPLVLAVAIRPTPSIALTQETVDLKNMRDAQIEVGGRHDPCIVPRAVPVIEAAVALAICEILKV